MRYLSLTAVVLMGLTCTLQAGVSFDFDAMPGGIENYMEGVYGSDITVIGATTATGAPLGPDQFIRDDGGNEFKIIFEDGPITGMSCDWVLHSDAFVIEADGTEVFYVPWNMGIDSGHTGDIVFADYGLGPVNELYFHDSNLGGIAIDNLMVTKWTQPPPPPPPDPNGVPAPGALLLGTIGVGLVGHLRRRKTL